MLIKGGSGVGNTMIAQNVGLAGLAAGYTVRFASLATALADLLNQESLPAFERRVRRYTDPDVLILDELGYLPCDSRAADMLYNIVSRRHEKRSTIASICPSSIDMSSSRARVTLPRGCGSQRSTISVTARCALAMACWAYAVHAASVPAKWIRPSAVALIAMLRSSAGESWSKSNSYA